MLMSGLAEPELQKGFAQTLRSRSKRLGLLFILTVVVPSALAILYFGILASDVYVSESRFVVRSPDKPAATGLGILLKSAGFTNAGDEIFAAQDYILSRDALAALNRDTLVVRAYSNNSISIFDRFNPFGTSSGFEDLYSYYEKKVRIERDSTSSIVTLTVQAYTPQDAKRINERLLEMAERTVNRLNLRGRQDLIHFAQAEVDVAAQRARAAALTLSAYRNRQGVVDPEKQAAVQIQMIAKLQDELIASRTELAQLKAIVPNNPQISSLQARIAGLADQIGGETGKVAGGVKSLAVTAAQYQRLALESQFADKQLASAMASLEEARNEALRKQAYVERIVQPNEPDEPLRPRRLRSIISTIFLGFIAWGILRLLIAGIREHVG